MQKKAGPPGTAVPIDEAHRSYADPAPSARLNAAERDLLRLVGLLSASSSTSWSYAGAHFFGDRTDGGRCERQIRRLIRRLERRGLVEARRRPGQVTELRPTAAGDALIQHQQTPARAHADPGHLRTNVRGDVRGHIGTALQPSAATGTGAATSAAAVSPAEARIIQLLRRVGVRESDIGAALRMGPSDSGQPYTLADWQTLAHDAQRRARLNAPAMLMRMARDGDRPHAPLPGMWETIEVSFETLADLMRRVGNDEVQVYHDGRYRRLVSIRDRIDKVGMVLNDRDQGPTTMRLPRDDAALRALRVRCRSRLSSGRRP